jgi:hypothetical protein
MIFQFSRKTVFYFSLAVNSGFSAPSLKPVAQPFSQGGRSLRQDRLLSSFLDRFCLDPKPLYQR